MSIPQSHPNGLRSVVTVPVLTAVGITVVGTAGVQVAAQATDLSNAPFWGALAVIIGSLISAWAVLKSGRRPKALPETPDVAKRLDRMERQATEVKTSLVEYRQANDKAMTAARVETREWIDEIMTELRAIRGQRRDNG